MLHQLLDRGIPFYSSVNSLSYRIVFAFLEITPKRARLSQHLVPTAKFSPYALTKLWQGQHGVKPRFQD